MMKFHVSRMSPTLIVKVMNNKTKSARIVLDIEWECADDSDLPSLWDWKRIKLPMDLTKVKYVGIQQSNGPENVSNWMGN
jgi:hypothetical protein